MISGQFRGHDVQPAGPLIEASRRGGGGRRPQVEQDELRGVQQAEDRGGRGPAQVEVGNPLTGERAGRRVADGQAGEADGQLPVQGGVRAEDRVEPVPQRDALPGSGWRSVRTARGVVDHVEPTGYRSA